MPPYARHARRLVRTCLVLLVAATALAACGDGDAEERPLSKREYIQRSNALQADAAQVVGPVDPATTVSPAAAGAELDEFDTLISGYDALRPPSVWQDEHAAMLGSLRSMRQAMSIVSKASARNTAVITTQLARFTEAQGAFERAVRDINASR